MDVDSTLMAYPCPLCACSERLVVMRKVGVAVPVEFTVVACRACGHVRVDPRVPDARLGALYSDAYYRGEGFDRTIDYAAPTTDAVRSDLNLIVDTVVEARGGLQGARWLDVGCGTGGLVEEARRRGALAFGVDSSEFARARCLERGIPLLTEREVAARLGSFDVVTAVEVIEHAPDPRSLLAHLRSCARVGGLVYVGTGNWNLVRRRPGTPYVMPEGHIQYFTPDGMRRLFAEVGLAEAPVLNRAWFVDRLLPRPLRRLAPSRALRSLAGLAVRWAPGVAPFPVGVRVAVRGR